MISQIPTDPKEKQALVTLAEKRYRASAEYYKPWHEAAVRYYKIYRALQDAVEDSDEPNTFLPYAFGLVEQIVSKAVEPILNKRPPSKAKPKRKGHEKAAENFMTVARNFYANARYQLGYIANEKEKIIVGTSFEIDSWASDYIKGKTWAKEPKTGIMDSIKSLAGKLIPLSDANEFPYEAEVEKEILIPERVGFQTEFPSFFDVFPEPRIKEIEESHWVVVNRREVAMDDLKKQFYIDPETGEKIPVYDLSEIEADYKGREPGAIQASSNWMETDYGQLAKEVVATSDSSKNEHPHADMDMLWLVDVHERGRLFTIAQGKYVIRCVKDHLHRPRIPIRIKVYTMDPQFLMGIGAIQPIEDEIYELNDIHNLSMSSWIRIINKMVAVRMDAVPFPDDFKPRAGGRVRVRSDVDPRQAIMAIDQQDPTPSMLNMESNVRGLIEWASSVADLSPGTEGTKQNHKTLGGLIEIQSNLNTRFGTINRMALANAAKQMDSMEAFFSQHQFDKVPLMLYRNDGSTALVEFNKDDIYTEGVGFDYVNDVDPSAGDDMIARAQLMGAFDLGLKYEEWRTKMGGQQAKRVDLSEIYRRILENLGWSDTSQVLIQANGSMDPQTELDMMIQGLPIKVQLGEDYIAHLLEHVIQRNSPVLKQNIASGKIPPQTLRNLDLHINETLARIQTIMADPQMAAEVKMQGIMMSRAQPDGPQEGSEMAMGGTNGAV